MDAFVDPPAGEVRAVVARALAEDLTPLGDVTSMLLDRSRTATGRFVARVEGRLSGGACVSETFHQVDPALVLDWQLADGSEVGPGTLIGTVTGPLASMLTAERTALNLLGHLSGVATLAARFRAAADPSTHVWDTRKTTPGLRSLEKAAVRAGGCVNHRGNLSEWVMLKDNHLVGVGIAEGVARAKAAWPGRTVQVECDRPAQVEEAVAAGADAVLLDNMSVDEAAACIATVRAADPRCLVEISGGITLDTIGPYSRIGADCISVGAITNSAPVLDIGLDITPGEGAP
ncbi:carboxylating nicotinate-nucleotide diphosphorylase [Actinomarinicola tropica]|nr:carboxylating nicotinate-nucleotide diphosphorylase [Actinomarinicola tropica]